MSVIFYDCYGDLIEDGEIQEAFILDVRNPEDADALLDWAQATEYTPISDFRFVETDGIYVWNEEAEAYLSLESLRDSVRWARKIGAILE